MDDPSNSSLVMLGTLVSGLTAPQAVPSEVWPDVIALALEHSLGPLLLWAVKQAAPEVITYPLWDPVISSMYRVGVQYVRLKNSQEKVQAALTAAGIPSLWLKGIALSATVYSQPVLRPMSDLDVLVPYELRQEALNTIKALGYYPVMGRRDFLYEDDELFVKTNHAYSLVTDAPQMFPIDLHFRLPSQVLPLEKLAWFWDQAQVKEGEHSFKILLPEAHLLYLCAHNILQHGEGHYGLLRYADLHLLITRREINWQIVLEQAVALEWVYALHRTLTLTVQFFGTPIPEMVITQLQNHLSDEDNFIPALRLRHQDVRGELTLNKIRQLTWPQRLRFLYATGVPSPDYMRQRYRVKAGRPVWPYYFYRWIDLSQATWHTLRNRFMLRGGKRDHPHDSNPLR